MMVDIDREKAYWRVHYGGLPKASAVRSFVRYWPLMSPGYDAYLRQPHADIDVLVQTYLGNEAVARILRPSEASYVFAQIWQRITGAHGAPAPVARQDAPPMPDTRTP